MDQPLIKKTSGKVYSYSTVNSAKDATGLSDPKENTSIRYTDSHVVHTPLSLFADPTKANIAASSYDYCLVLPTKHADLTLEGKKLLEALIKLGFDTVVYRGVNESHHAFILLRLPLETMRNVAEADELYLMLDASVAKTAIQRGNSSHGIQPAFIAHRPDITTIPPFQYIYAPYRRSLEHLYAKASSSSSSQSKATGKTAAGSAEGSAEATHPFTPLVRLKTIAMLLYSRPLDNSEGINMHHRLRDGSVLACFPLHDSACTAALEKKLTLYPIKNLPLKDLKDYLGEKIGVYFAFAEHLASWLVYPAMVGIPLQLFVFLRGSLSGKHCLCNFGTSACGLIIFTLLLCRDSIGRVRLFRGAVGRVYAGGKPTIDFPDNEWVLHRCPLPTGVLQCGLYASLFYFCTVNYVLTLRYLLCDRARSYGSARRSCCLCSGAPLALRRTRSSAQVHHLSSAVHCYLRVVWFSC
jgi:hypothetical protein